MSTIQMLHCIYLEKRYEGSLLPMIASGDSTTSRGKGSFRCRMILARLIFKCCGFVEKCPSQVSSKSFSARSRMLYTFSCLRFLYTGDFTASRMKRISPACSLQSIFPDFVTSVMHTTRGRGFSCSSSLTLG